MTAVEVKSSSSLALSSSALIVGLAHAEYEGKFSGADF
jgi:hypothetical protein|eukprot:COSAG06_NODE_563_length_14268_cov_25.500670_8_plen_38_part_00